VQQTTGEFFGAHPQQEMQRIASALWPLLRDNPRFAYEGRFVGLDAPEPPDLEAIVALAGTQGGTASFFLDIGREAVITSACRQRATRPTAGTT
jgi:hypothetical protein